MCERERKRERERESLKERERELEVEKEHARMHARTNILDSDSCKIEKVGSHNARQFTSRNLPHVCIKLSNCSMKGKNLVYENHPVSQETKSLSAACHVL